VIPRKNIPLSLFPDALRAEFRTGRDAAHRGMRRAMRTRNSRMVTGIATAAVVGGITVGVAASWSGSAPSSAGTWHAVTGTRGAAFDDAIGEKASAASTKFQGAHTRQGNGGTVVAHAPAHGNGGTSVTHAPAHGKAPVLPAAPGKPKATAKPPAPAKPAPPPEPYLIYDSVTPTAIPWGQRVATYSDGPYQASSASVAGRDVLWIDTNGSNIDANALDVEPGDATPAGAAAWVSARLYKHPYDSAIVYTMRAEWGAVLASIQTLPSWMQNNVRYWIADPTGTPHMVPGAMATQWYWGSSYDITTANPGFWR